MDFTEALISAAEDIASKAHRRVRALEAELTDTPHHKEHVEAALREAKLTDERLSNYQARTDRNYQCPRCWVRDGARFKVRPVPSSSANDVLRCDRCGSDWIMPIATKADSALDGSSASR